jgi:thiol-disulfide isomerase/thioredoxin
MVAKDMSLVSIKDSSIASPQRRCYVLNMKLPPSSPLRGVSSNAGACGSRFVPLAIMTVLLASAAAADDVKLDVLTTGAMPKMGSYRPQRLQLSTEFPSLLKNAPRELKSPLFGVLKLGPKESPTSFVVAVDEPQGGAPRLFVDANANGDLTDDPPAEWKTREYKDKAGASLSQASGGATVKVSYGSETAEFRVAMYRFDKNDSARDALKNVLLYYADYARSGTVTLGGKTIPALLADDFTTGDFRGDAKSPNSTIGLRLDLDGDGRFESRPHENFDIRKPFNIGGTTYEVTDMTAAGDTFKIVKSAKTVAEVARPYEAKKDQKAIAFKAKTTEGKEIDFPSSYKGKLVLLDFWATWCGPCIAELPKLKEAYAEFHPKGVEVLGVSLDKEDWETKLAEFTKKNGMPWPQIYDGKFWQAEIAQKYSVNSIPRPILVDGDTGKVLASGPELRGEILARTLATAIEKKKKGE